jgi:hypothetical protein
MTRFDPNSYPDRFAFDAYARKLQSDEMARLSAAALARLTAAFDYVVALASTPISRETRTGTPGR